MALSKTIPNQRLFDLIRYCRHELHEQKLITDDEYTALAMEAGALDRLEDYYELRQRLEEALCHGNRNSKPVGVTPRPGIAL